MGGTSPLFATATPTPNAVPISDGSGTLNAWVSDGSGGIGSVNPQTGTTYTLQLSDGQNTVTLTNGSGIVVTIPDSAAEAFPVNTQIVLVQLGAGQVQVVPDAGVTLIARDSFDKLAGLGAMAVLLQADVDVWVFNGDTAA